MLKDLHVPFFMLSLAAFGCGSGSSTGGASGHSGSTGTTGSGGSTGTAGSTGAAGLSGAGNDAGGGGAPGLDASASNDAVGDGSGREAGPGANDGSDGNGTNDQNDGGGTHAEVGGVANCGAVPMGQAAPYSPVYRIQLLVHRTRSDIPNDQLCNILSELNKIWWTQAAVCFEIRTTNDDKAMMTGLDLWLERSTPFPDGVTANGVTGGAHEIYVLDHPSLARAPHPVMYPTARTMAHELGHALSLQHQNPDQEMNCVSRGTECDDLLMRSGYDGFQIVTGSPANVNEKGKARTKAMTLALPDMTPVVCGAAQLQ